MNMQTTPAKSWKSGLPIKIDKSEGLVPSGGGPLIALLTRNQMKRLTAIRYAVDVLAYGLSGYPRE